MDSYLPIEAYLKNELSAEERQAFETQLKTDSDLRDKVDDFRLILDGFDGLKIAKMEANIEQWTQSLPRPQADRPSPTIGRRVLMRWAAAACLIGLLATAGWWFLNQNNGTSTPLALNYLYITPTLDITRSGEIGASPFQNGDVLFSQGQFEAAIQALQAIPTTDSNYLDAQYLISHAYYQLDQTEAAIKGFDQSLQLSQAPQYYKYLFEADNAQWTRLLTDVKAYNLAPSETKAAKLQQAIDAFIAQQPEASYLQLAQTLKQQLQK